MKIFKRIFLAAIICIMAFSCQKELKFDGSGVSAGVFKKDSNGNCTPVSINGVYKVDSSLTAANFVDVQVNVSTPGTFEIRSDTINGCSFRKVGSVIFGTNIIRLYASGKPLTAGINIFTIKYGTSICTFEITVAPKSTGTANFILGGSPTTCTGAIVGGTYVAGIALAPSNTLTVQVNVISVGTYIIGAATTNGFLFSGSGMFSSTGLQNVVLTGVGTPLNAGATPVTVTNIATTCAFSVTVQSGTGGGSTPFQYFEFTDDAGQRLTDTTTIATGFSTLGSNSVFGLTVLSKTTLDTTYSMVITTNTIPVTGVTYNTSSTSLPFSSFAAAKTTGSVFMADQTTPLHNIAIKFDVIDIPNKVVSGTFNGTAKVGTSGTRTITNGKFRVRIP
jgi:hypothetical protein